MFTLFSRIILSNLRALIVLFIVIIFASTGFITLRQITMNIESLVMTKTRSFFGADLIIDSRGYASGDILPSVLPLLEDEKYQASERRKFSTTLIDKEGKTGLVDVVAYSGSYPQRGVLHTLSGNSLDLVVATLGVAERFASSGQLIIDGKSLILSDIITESSDLGFSFGTDNHLIVLPSRLLSGSLLLSSGSRLDHSLLLSFSDETRTRVIAEKIRKSLPEKLYRIRTYDDRNQQNLDIVDTLTDYITLILCVASIFAFVILRSAHESFFESVARTFRITFILGLTRRCQRILLLILYGSIFPPAITVGITISYLIIRAIEQTDAGSDFRFFWWALPEVILILSMILVIAWFPTWWKIRESSEQDISRPYPLVPLSHKEKILSFLRGFITYISRPDIFIPSFLGILVLWLLFEDLIFSLSVGVAGVIFLSLCRYLIIIFYSSILMMIGSLREKRFYLYDGIRTLVRPLTPTVPITISLVLVTVFFIVFSSFSLAFRERIVIDRENAVNIYAINLFEKDIHRISERLGSGAFLYDILRARITRINGKTLASHLSNESPSGEFTREFNITTTPLQDTILRGKLAITRGEVSVDERFSRRLGVDIGDRITFLLSGREVSLTVANIRKSTREGFRPFFYFSFDPIEFVNAPRTYIIATYTPDIEAWKKDILSASGPYVTFVDVENILKVIRDISGKILSVIGLFGAVILLFAIGAIGAFFIRMRPLEEMKIRLYSLFGAERRDIQRSLSTTRGALFLISYILSVILGGILSYAILSRGAFFVFSFGHFLMIIGSISLFYIIMILLWRRGISW